MADAWAFGWDQLFTLLNAIAVAGASGVGVWGLRTWRQEHIDTRKMQIVEGALALVYRAQEVFDDIRDPGSFAGEGRSRPRAADDVEGSELTHQRDANYIPLERLSRHVAFFEEVAGIRPRVRAFLGEDAEEPLKTLLLARRKVRQAALRHAQEPDMHRAFHSAEQERRWFERQEKRDQMIWKGAVEPDPVDEMIAEARRRAECFALPLLRPRKEGGGGQA